MVKMTGSEWNRFYSESWPEGSWHDGEEMTMDGEELTDDFDLSDVPDTAVLRLSGGIVYLDGDVPGPSLEAYFKQWRKRQNTTVLLVEAPNKAVEAVRAAIVAAGGKVKG